MAVIPDTLMQRLHQATEHFSDVRKRSEDLSTMSAAQRAQFTAEFSAAERDLEEISGQIESFLNDTESSGQQGARSNYPAWKQSIC